MLLLDYEFVFLLTMLSICFSRDSTALWLWMPIDAALSQKCLPTTMF